MGKLQGVEKHAATAISLVSGATGVALVAAGEILKSEFRDVVPQFASRFVADSAPAQVNMIANEASSIGAYHLGNATMWLQMNLYNVVPAAKGFAVTAFVEFLSFLQTSPSSVLPISSDKFSVLNPGNSTLINLGNGYVANATLTSASFESKTATFSAVIGHIQNAITNQQAVDLVHKLLGVANIEMTVGAGLAVGGLLALGVNYLRGRNGSKSASADQ